MSFFKLSTGEEAPSTKTFEADNNIAPMPNGTILIAAIDEIKWGDYQGDEYIDARWTCLDGEYKNRKIFQKIRVKDENSMKRDKAMKMLLAIDANAGGKLHELGTEPSDIDLTHSLANKPMAIKLLVWEMETDSGFKTGNWVCAVSPVNASSSPAPEQQAAPATTSAPDFDDDIPF